MVKDKTKTRKILLAMLWSLQKASEGCMPKKRMSRKEFVKKYKCRDEEGIFS